jgi:hypothetical protein
MFAQMRGELEAQHHRHLREYAELRRELDEVRGQFEALCAAVRDREKAEVDLAVLHRDRDRRTCIAEGHQYWLH